MIYSSICGEIRSLIDSKCEGPYWDFKSKHHDSKVDLLHDIICMANNLCDRNAYLIFGVDDEFHIIGVENDTGRRDLKGFRDLLRDKSFAGGVRPEINLLNFVMEGHEIDVLVVMNSISVPFYLTVDYKSGGKKVSKYSIYVRVNDTNTAIDSCADINHIEYIWRKRLGVDLPTKKRFERLLEDHENWVQDWGNKDEAYHQLNPEYRIVSSPDNMKGIEPISVFFPDMNMWFSKLKLYCHSTTIYETDLWMFDGFRVILPAANRHMVSFKPMIFFDFYDLSTFDGKLYSLIKSCEGNRPRLDTHIPIFLEFDSNDEMLNFNKFLLENVADFDIESEKEKHKFSFDTYERENGSEIRNPFIFWINEMYVKWKNLQYDLST